jgi:hypothetical protein
MPHTTFEDIYTSFGLNTIHRYFGPSDAGFIAIFALFELLHNLKDLVGFINGSDKDKQYAFKWYKSQIESILSGTYSLSIYPAVYEYIFKGKVKNRKKILKKAQKEFIQILERTNLLEYFSNIFFNIKNDKEVDS